MRSELEHVIKDEIEHIFGRRIISSRDCIQLSQDIFRKTQFQLNPNTLRRLFGIVKKDHTASLATLNILSTYCGFLSIEDLNSKKRDQKDQASFIEQSSILTYLVSIFQEANIDFTGSQTYDWLMKHTVTLLNNNLELAGKFQNLIAKTPFGQQYYFERFVHIDKLNNYYGDGLRYYIREKGGPEAAMFGHALQIFRYWLTMENEKLEQHFKLMNKKVSNSLPAFICGRYFAALLYQAHSHSKATDDIITEIYLFYAALKDKESNNQSLADFESLIGEALILTGKFEEGLYYINRAIKNSNEQNVHQSLYLLQIFALQKIGRAEKVKERFHLIKPYEFHFLSKKFMMALYLSLLIATKRKVSKSEDQLTSLIGEIEFPRLHTFL